MAELKKCPFCGGKALVVEAGIGGPKYFVRCSRCQVSQEKLYFQKCDAVKAWNKRKVDEDTDVPANDCISRQAAIDKFIDGLEAIFAEIRERFIDDSVCGLCEYDGAYLGQSGDWCNECPGFEKDDCFKLSGKIRKEWTDKIIKALPSAQPEQQWISVTERLPEDDSACLVTVKYRDIRYIDIAYCFTSKDGSAMGWVGANDDDVMAWMPLPKPWIGGTDE